MAEKFELLINDPLLYPPEFVTKYGSTSVHWELENWLKRERSLLHDMMCILLANLEPSESSDDIIIKSLKRKTEQKKGGPSKKRFKKDCLTEGATPIDNYSSSGESNSDSENETYLNTDDEDMEYDPLKDFEDTNVDILKYRYIVLEGCSNASELQNYFVNKWNCVHPTKLFDIIDSKEKKLIELKTTTNLPRILKEYSLDKNTNEYTSLVTVDLNENQIDFHNKLDDMPGLSKAYNFLIRRKATMKTLDISDKETDEFNLNDLVFKSEYLNSAIIQMKEMFEDNIKTEVNITDIDNDEFKIEDISTEKMFSYLRKPLMEDHGETCSFKGKLTPFFMCKAMELEDDKDLFAVDTFLMDFLGGISFVSGDFNLYVAVNNLSTNWFEKQGESKHFGFINIANKGEFIKMGQEVKDAFRIGKKGKVFNANIENPKQPEREPITKKNYPSWFEPLYEELSKESLIGNANIVNIESKSSVSMHEFMSAWLQKFIDVIGARNLGVYIDQITNFYSRISGSYNTTVGTKTTHSNIAAIPIKMVTRIEGETKRWITGVAFRGPHHMRSATDKSNLLIVEKIKDINSIPKHFYKNSTFIKTEDSIYIIRMEAVKKIDGIHLTFIKNSVFIACNMIGDIIMRHKNFQTEDAFKQLCASHLTNESSLNFFVDRVIDATLMAVIGNSRDEGYLSVFRKFFMVLLNRRRQQSSFTFDVKGMCEKLNECLIDNPLSMFFQNSLLYMIANY